MTILIFFIVLFVLVLVHEWGHFIVAKKTGMRVDEFGIGFPPKVASVQKGETEYSFNLLPIGGFVRIYGEDGVSTPSSPVPPEGGESDAKLDAEAGLGGVRSASADTRRSFTAKSKWAQAAVLIAGVAMNVVLAWFLFFMILVIGTPTAIEEKDATEAAELVIAQVSPDSPAEAVGIPVGATVTGLTSGPDRDQILNESSFRAFIEDHGNQELSLTYVFDGKEERVALTPTTGLVEGLPDQPAIGVVPVLTETVRTPFYTAWWDALVRTKDGLILVTVGLSGFIADAVVGKADLDQVAGPVGIVGLVDDAVSFGFTSLLTLMAYLSLSLAVINMLPIPALDGGRLLFVGIEAIIRRPINPVWVMRVNTAGFVLLIGLMIVITYSDIMKLF